MPAASTDIKTGFFLMIGILLAIFVLSLAVRFLVK